MWQRLRGEAICCGGVPPKATLSNKEMWTLCIRFGNCELQPCMAFSKAAFVYASFSFLLVILMYSIEHQKIPKMIQSPNSWLKQVKKVGEIRGKLRAMQMVLCYFDAIRMLVETCEISWNGKIPQPPFAWPQNSSSEGVKKTNSCRDYTRFFKREVSAPSRNHKTQKICLVMAWDVALQQHLLFSTYAMKLGSHQRHLGCKNLNQWPSYRVSSW